MITKNQIKLIKSLTLKKNREKHQLFVVEGIKNVAEALNSDYEVDSLFATNNWITENPTIDTIKVTHRELKRISNQKNPNEVLALVRIKENRTPDTSKITLVLNDINDPGNLGTIIRTADWFGIKNLYLSKDSVDVYNPKVLNSTKGSFSRVSVHYVDLEEFLVGKVGVSAEMIGENLYDFEWPLGGVIIMGNESHGVSEKVSSLCSNKITIPSFGGAESLNVGVATSIICSDIMSKFHQK